MSQRPPKKNIALIVAAGRGVRAGLPLPKQYQDLAGQPVLARTIAAFLSHAAIDAVQVIIADTDQDLYHSTTAGLHHDKLLPPVIGGEERQQSVLKGLQALADHTPEFVLIHDGVRPFITDDVITRLMTACSVECDGAIAAIPLADTLKRERGEHMIAETIDRQALWRAQTPQVFRYNNILGAHLQNQDKFLTDDAAVAEAAGLTVKLVTGDPQNIKLTTKADFTLAEALLKDKTSMQTQTGFGFDVHRFEDGDYVTLCGITIPYSRKLEGHSDADVPLHALTDALLGAVAEGDIGSHFPPTDERWRDISSDVFITHSCKLIRNRGADIVHVDVTIICEEPKIGPHREAMRTNLAKMMQLSETQVSVKATTTERLGFTGRKEGIAAQAVATLRVPLQR